jgi:hypothetical protein
MGLQFINENFVYSVDWIANKCRYEPLEKLKYREECQHKWWIYTGILQLNNDMKNVGCVVCPAWGPSTM